MKVSLFLLVFFMVFEVLSQCCSPGNPVGGSSNLGTLNEGSWKVIAYYRYSSSGKYYDGSKPFDPYFVKSGSFNYSGLLISHAISQKITIDFEVGYFITKGQEYVTGVIPKTKTGYGLADFFITPKLNLLKRNDWEITSGLGLKIPLGSYKRKFKGAIAEIDIQPTSGAVDYIHTLYVSKEFPQNHLRFFIYNRIEVKRPNPRLYKYGNLYATSFYTSISMSTRFDFILQARSEIRAKDERPGQTPPYRIEKIPISGSQKIFFSPQINFNGSQTWSVSALVDIPVYQYYNKQQLANSYAVSIVFSKKFNPKI